MSQAKPKPVFEQVSDEIKSGGFSILSQKAQDRILDFVRMALDDGYQRGYDAGLEAAQLDTAKLYKELP